jgi:outer membrane protein assembly factor BamB
MRKTLTIAIAALGVLAFPAATTATATAAMAAPAAASVSTACPDTAHGEDAAHDGHNCSAVPPNASQLWSVTLNAPASYPVIAGGRVFVTTSSPGGSYGGDLYALDASTGKTVWGPVSLSGTYYYFPLAFAGGRVFANNFDGTVTAFNAATGAQEWSTPTNNFSGEPVVSQGTVWVDGSDGVTGLSAKTGAMEAQSGELDGNGATLGVDGSGVYLSAGCSQIKLSLAAEVVWDDNAGCDGGGGAPSSLWRGRMYGREGDEILDQSTGAKEGTFTGVPAFSGGTGYFANGTTVSAVKVSNNKAQWTATLPATITEGPVVTPSAVWVATDAPSLVALDPSTGSVLSAITLPGIPGGGGEYSGDPADLGVGNNILVVPTGAIVTAFG